MYQIKVNSILMPTIFWSLQEAIEACHNEQARGYSVITEIVALY